MTARLLSLNLGASEPNPAKKVGVTGIGKKPVEAATLRAPGPKRGGLGSGVVGDFIADVKHHGGDQQAVYAFAREELDAWQERLGRELVDGSFGENLTTSGLDVDGALLGERWAVGDEVVLEVCGPRIPCATFQARMGEKGWVRRSTIARSSSASGPTSAFASRTLRAWSRSPMKARNESGTVTPWSGRETTSMASPRRTSPPVTTDR